MEQKYINCYTNKYPCNENIQKFTGEKWAPIPHTGPKPWLSPMYIGSCNENTTFFTKNKTPRTEKCIFFTRSDDL